MILSLIVFCSMLASSVMMQRLVFLNKSAGKYPYPVLSAASLGLAYLVSIYVSTLLIFVLLLAGISVLSAGFVVLLLFLLLGAYSLLQYRKKSGSETMLKAVAMKGGCNPTWYEWLVVLLVLFMFIMSVRFLLSTPLFFSDAINHWSGRARSLMGQVNWSWDREAAHFLGHVGSNHYPLAIPIWRAFMCSVRGEWNDFLASFDCVLSGLCLLMLMWSIVWQLTKQRWAAVLSVLIMIGFPLFRWHLVSGYVDMLVAAYFIGAIHCILHRQWLLAGVLAAGCTWVKNDGAILFMPVLFLITGLMQPLNWKEAAKGLLLFAVGLLSIFPWQVFRLYHGLALSPTNSAEIEWHRDAPYYFWKHVFAGDESNFFWFLFILALVFSFKKLILDQRVRALILGFGAIFSLIVFVFSSTDAYLFLKNEMTIHRSMLQITPLGVILFVTALSKLSVLNACREQIVSHGEKVDLNKV